MTHREIESEIRKIMDALDLIKTMPAVHADIQDKIYTELNRFLQFQLKRYHKALSEIVFDK